MVQPGSYSVIGAPMHGDGDLPGSLAGLLERAARDRGGRPALVGHGGSLSYDELNGRANQMARLLLERGLGPGRLVALALPRSSHLVVSVLAVAKAGAAFLPLDVSYPQERLGYLLADARPDLLCTYREGLTRLPPGITCPEMVLDSPEQSALIAARPATDLNEDEFGHTPAAGDLAYVIYTSGSTGRPKGVAVTGSGLPGLAEAKVAALGVTEQSRMLQFASPSFDAYLTELLATLTAGATLVIPEPGPLTGEPLVRALRDGRVSHAVLPPAAVATISPERVPDLRVLVVAGEACPPGLVERWAPGRVLINAYGPTEATVCATMTGPMAPGDEVTIGRPIPGVSVCILDDELQPVRPGQIGELYLAGPGLARGYLNRPDLTAERFVANPFGAAGERLYRTGDLGSLRADGEIVFHGRADDQVKLRGFRIEPGEVEAVLARHPDVAQAVVTLRDDGSGPPRLLAHVVRAAGAAPVSDELRGHAARFLPDYMVPSVCTVIDALPLTPSGKVDRAALLTPGPATRSSGREPRTAVEKLLCDIFRDLFEQDDIDVESNFFELGGNSILAVDFIQRAQDAGLRILPRTVLNNPTIEQLAAVAATGE